MYPFPPADFGQTSYTNHQTTLALFFAQEFAIGNTGTSEIMYYISHKKQLFFIPIFGLYLQKINMISINRSEGTKAMRIMLKQAKQRIIRGNSIVIFPEGTRKKPGDIPDYKTGIAGIYQEAETEILPVALNSGYCWPKHSFIKRPGHITIQFLDLIPAKLERSEILKKIQSVIEEETKKLSNFYSKK